MASSRPAPCCPKDSEPLLLMKDYSALGEMITLNASLPCYVARRADSTSRAVVMFSDMFGVHTGRHKQLCDDLAADGFIAVCPDFFVDAPYMKRAPAYGSTLCCVANFICGLASGSYAKNTKKHTWDATLRVKVMDIVVPWLQSQGARDFAAVGFCWGSYGSQKCGAQPVFKCCASFPPATDGFCKNVGEDDLQVCREATCPQLMVVTKTESDRWQPGSVAHKASEEATQGRLTWKLEGAASHGYMTRGDTKSAETMEAVKRGYKDMVALFEANMA
mmetsp:Transcript_66183/g.132799  ORF Transcript_66183/g.132799 Transcript_66183/m.132799 type:complete len:276 (+) Transcript_66183:70-897(+)